MAEALTRAMAPMGGIASTGEIADFLRRECAQELEDERGRIDRATEHLKDLAGRGMEVPDFGRKRARPVVETTLDLQIGRKLTQPFDPAEAVANTSAVTSVGAPSSEVVRQVRARRRGLWIGLVGLGLAGAAGIAGGLYVAGEEADEPIGEAVVAEPPAPTPPAADQPAPPPAQEAAQEAAIEEKQAAAAEKREEEAPPPAVTEPEKRPSSSSNKSGPARSTPSTAATSVIPAGPGYLSMDSMPYSEVFVDGKSVGITPLIKIPVKPGKHAIRAVTQDGQTKKLSITVQSGKTISKRIEIGEK
jgi:serine/threonine-protein kinase